MTTTVEQWERVVQQLRESLQAAEAELLAARVALAPFKVGDVVEAQMHGRIDWQPALITKVELFSGFSVWYWVSLRKKNGEWGIPRRAYSGVRKVQGPDHG